MSLFKGAFKFFVAIAFVLGSFNSAMAMEESIKEERKYKVISREEWQQILKDDALRERVLRKKVEELIEKRESECTSGLSLDGIERFLCKIGYPRFNVYAIVKALKQECNRGEFKDAFCKMSSLLAYTIFWGDYIHF